MKRVVSRSGRFSGGPAADVAAFSESISFDWRLWKHDIQGSLAHAAMLQKIGILTQQELAAIRRGFDSIVQAATGESVEIAYVDQGYTGEAPYVKAAGEGIELVVVKLPKAKRGFVLLPKRWVVERSFAWMARFRRLARDYERLSETLAGWHWLCFATLMLRQFISISA